MLELSIIIINLSNLHKKLAKIISKLMELKSRFETAHDNEVLY